MKRERWGGGEKDRERERVQASGQQERNNSPRSKIELEPQDN